MTDFTVGQQEGAIQLAGDMTIYSSAALKQALLPIARSQRDAVELDLSRVSALDTAGVQLLLILHRMARIGGLRFCVLNPSSEVREVIGLYGLSELLCVRYDPRTEA